MTRTHLSGKALCFSWWALDICMLRKWSFLCGSYFAFLCNLCSSRSYFGTISIRCQHFWDSGSIPCAHFAAIGSLCWERPALQALSRIWPNLRWNLSMRNSKTGWRRGWQGTGESFEKFVELDRCCFSEMWSLCLIMRPDSEVYIGWQQQGSWCCHCYYSQPKQSQGHRNNKLSQKTKKIFKKH